MSSSAIASKHHQIPTFWGRFYMEFYAQFRRKLYLMLRVLFRPMQPPPRQELLLYVLWLEFSQSIRVSLLFSEHLEVPLDVESEYELHFAIGAFFEPVYCNYSGAPQCTFAFPRPLWPALKERHGHALSIYSGYFPLYFGFQTSPTPPKSNGY